MAGETTDYPAVLSFIHEQTQREDGPPGGVPAPGLEKKKPSGGPSQALDLGLSAAVAARTVPGQPPPEYRVFTAGWPAIDAVMILKPATRPPADFRVALLARSERALRDLLRAFPAGKVGCFTIAAAWMRAALSEFFEPPCPLGRMAAVSSEPGSTLLGIKRGTNPGSGSPADRRSDRAPRESRANGEIHGSRDPVLAQLRALSQNGGRRERSQFIVEGERLVHRAIGDGLPIDRIVFTPELAGTEGGVALLRDARERHLAHFALSEGLMAKITSTRPVPAAAAAVFTQFREAEGFRTGAGTTLLITEAVNNPENLGMVLRTADAAGVEGVVVLGDRSDPYHKLCVRAARGAVGRLPLLSCAEPLAYLRRLREQGFRLLGATAHAETSLFRCALNSPLAVLVGNEQTGLSPALLEACTERVRIPMAAGQSSLNVGVAAGVLLYELLRQRLAE